MTINLGDLSLHLRQTGKAEGPSVLFLHGWPQSNRAFEAVMKAMADEFRLVAIDLPGVGRSTGLPRAADKETLAGYVEAAIRTIGLEEVTLVGHDVGGQIVYAYLRQYAETIERAAILNVAIPGLDPWADVIRNPYLWHFAFHAVPDLPELLVQGHQAEYFDFFYNAIAKKPAAITRDARHAYVEAYSSHDALKAGFDWYRAFAQDAKDNCEDVPAEIATPVLYVRGDAESGKIEDYLAGLRQAGLVRVTGEVLADCGHFSPEEQPQALATALREFMQGVRD